MSAADKVKVVLVEELGNDLGAERERDTSVVLSPAHSLLVGVGPEEITEQTVIRHVSGPHDTTDLLHRLQVGAQSWINTPTANQCLGYRQYNQRTDPV
mgnify:CR=1 FL=1